MALPRREVVDGMLREYEAFAALLRTLNDDEWRTPTRCEGWTVADVAAHVTATLTEVVNFRLEGLGTPEVTQGLVEERRGRSPAEIADELEHSTKLAADVAAGFTDEAWMAPAPGGVQGTLGYGVETLWYDTYVHAADIRAAIGRPEERGPGLRAAVSHVAQTLTDQGYPPATLALDGVEEFPVSRGGGQRIEADPVEFVLVATGRRDPAPLGLDERINIYR